MTTINEGKKNPADNRQSGNEGRKDPNKGQTEGNRGSRGEGNAEGNAPSEEE